MSKIQIRKSRNYDTSENLSSLSKDELIAKIEALQAHNNQLKNLLSKADVDKSDERKIKKMYDFQKCNFRHVFLKICYLGWDYHGYVIQENTTKTIEFHLFNALIKTCLIKDRASSNYHRCGRTDKGVSSFGQVISITLRSKLSSTSDDYQNELDYCKMLNSVLPDNIQCMAWAPVEENLSARFDCKRRIYRYFFPKGKLNIEKIKEASKYLIGIHDFRNFCKMDVGNGVVEFIRNIIEIDVELCDDNNKNVNEYSMFVIKIMGQAFLWHQIRCIMSVLFLIGEGNEKPEVILDLFDVKSNPRKPEYQLASEIPLNLFNCEYDQELKWQWNQESTEHVLQNLRTSWAFASIKSSMLKDMITDLCSKSKSSETGFSAFQILVPDRSKKYIPLLQRQKCDSLEDKVSQYLKRRKLEIKESGDN